VLEQVKSIKSIVSKTSYFLKRSSNPEVFLWPDTPPLLSHLDIELTERCNNDCIHCSIHQQENSELARARELSADDIKVILGEAASLGALTVRFTGGEPLLRDDFEEIYLSARKLGFKVLLFTNARLITPHMAELFAKTPLLDKIQVTVYGMSEESYETCVRGKGAYSEFKKGIDLLLLHNIPFIVKGALLPSAKYEIDDFEAWAQTIPWMDRPPAMAMLFNLRDRRDSEKKNELIRKIRPDPGTYISILRRHPTYLEEMITFCHRFSGPAGDRLFRCNSSHSACVDPYGNLQLCLPLRHPQTVYPLRKGSLQDALTSFFPEIRKMKAGNSEYLERCAICFLKGLCEQCPAKSWSEHGTLDTPVEYLCEITHAVAEDIGLLCSHEKAWQVKNWKDRVAKAAAKLL
jgi:radical SAM protein with 4Fe4S-binding SPASM domain